jgi:hypothetical protein
LFVDGLDDVFGLGLGDVALGHFLSELADFAALDRGDISEVPTH